MSEKKITSRKKQAVKTKKKIFDIAVSLMEERGYNNLTIEDICQRANVSVGSFYHYYKTKEDVFFELYKKADEYFEETVIPDLLSHYEGSVERIIHFFGFYGRYNNEKGLENVSQLYSTKNKLFKDNRRYMVQSLIGLIREGQKKGELSSDFSAEEISNYLFIFSRGIIMDWCIHDGDYDLEKRFIAMMRNFLRIFI